MATFPLVSPPAHYGAVFPARNRSGIAYVGDAPIYIALAVSNQAATTYTVLDRNGNTVVTGAFGTKTYISAYNVYEVALGTPVGGWLPGWYRVRVTGAITGNATYGDSYGACNFVVFRTHEGIVVERDGTAGAVLGLQASDPVLRGVVAGMGPTRFNIKQVNTPLADPSDNLTNMVTLAGIAAAYKPSDPVRSWEQWCSFSDRTEDELTLQNSGGGAWLYTLPYTAALNGNNLYLKVENGTLGGTTKKLTVLYPDTSTPVKVYDNLTTSTAAAAIINADSDYIRVFIEPSTPTSTGANLSATAIGGAFGAGVQTCVSTLYPLGVTRFEGPKNEPSIGTGAVGTVHTWKLFQEHVHLGHPDAVAIGPSPVNITGLAAGPAVAWRPLLDELDNVADVFTPDGLAFHDYGSGGGDINSARYQIESFLATLKEYGRDGMEMWQTEATSTLTQHYGVYKPHFARIPIRHALLWEQYGIPRERNPYWYDGSHGFWTIPAATVLNTGSPNPHVMLYRILAEETFGMLHHHRVDFGSVPANEMFFGSVYAQPPEQGLTSVAVLFAHSYMHEGSSVTLNVDGTTSDLVLSDCDGRLTDVEIVGGQATIDIDEYPWYLRLPAGVTITVAETSPLGDNVNPSVSSASSRATIGGFSNRIVADNKPMQLYTQNVADVGIARSTASLPDTVEVIFDTDVAPDGFDLDGVVVHFPVPFQQMPTGVDFDIDTLDVSAVLPTDTGAISPSASSDNSGIGTVTWSNTNRVYVNDESSAACSSMANAAISHYLFASGLGLAVPGGATILGVVAEIKGSSSGGGAGVFPSSVKLLKAGAVAGTAKSGSTFSPTTGTYQSLGGGTDLWGTTLTPSDVNNSGFGVAVSITNLSGGVRNGGIDHIRVTVYYTTGTFPLPWTTRWTPSVETPTSVKFGTDANDTGCSRETAWREQHIFAKTFDSPITCKGWRVNARALSYGGHPDAASNVACQDPGMDPPKVVMIEMQSLSDTEFALSSTNATTPDILVDPEVVGEPNVGQQVATVNGFFSGFPTKYIHVWERSTNGTTGWAAISGATKAEYLLQAADGAKYVRRGTVASNTAGATSTVYSAAFGPIEEELVTGIPFTRPFGVPSLTAPGIVFTPTSGAT